MGGDLARRGVAGSATAMAGPRPRLSPFIKMCSCICVYICIQGQMSIKLIPFDSNGDMNQDKYMDEIDRLLIDNPSIGYKERSLIFYAKRRIAVPGSAYLGTSCG